MEPEKVSGNLRRIIELEEKINKKGRLEFGDKEVIEYNHLVASLDNLSIDDLMAFYKEEEKDYTAISRELQELEREVVRENCS